MNFAHLHLIVNHIPVIGLPIALLFLGFGLYKRNKELQRFSLFVLFAIAALVLPVYFTGEPGEEVVEHLPGVVKSIIETHEDAAFISLVLTLAAGLAAGAALFFQAHLTKSLLINFGVWAIAFVAVISLGYTANLGGKVRHTELRSNVDSQQVEGQSASDAGESH
jgi:hypothetical protein